MSELLPVIDAIMQYLVVPVVVWNWALHKGLTLLSTEVAVLKAEAIARDIARREEREATSKQLDQILSGINTVNNRIDAILRETKK